jgi:seryl-tRNA synthetase
MLKTMLDLKFIRDNKEAVKLNTENRHVKADVDLVASLYDERGNLIQKLEALRQERNENAQKLKQKLAEKERQHFIELGKSLKTEIPELEEKLKTIEEQLFTEAKKIPNLSHPEAPIGAGDEACKTLKTWGTIPSFSFKSKDHVVLSQELDLVDFDTATIVSGSKFYYLKNEAVILELALERYTLDILKDENFILTITPDIAKEEIVESTGFNPRGEESNIYALEGTGTCLVGTAEITLGGYYFNQILDAEKLPIKLAGLSHCFRREAGAAGQYSKGLYRVHQFSKVEMFIYCHPSQSDTLHDYLLALEEKIFQGLGIPYRVLDICTGDLGGPAYRKFDIEAWMPGRGENGEWGEVTSTSNCTDYQARRLGTRIKEQNKSVFVHMLNGTAIAISRAIIAVLENYQQADGSILIPPNLVKYTGFSEIKPKKKA